MSLESRRGVRTAQESSSGEYLAEDAPHWKAEPFIPVTAAELKGVLLSHAAAAPRRDELSRVFESLTSILNHDFRNLHQQLEAHYTVLDPDRDLKLLTPPNEQQYQASLRHVRGYLQDLLSAANFTKLNHEQICGAVHGTAGPRRVRLQVNLDIFESLDVYARGDIVGVRTHRLWRNFRQLTEFEVPIYQRLVAVYHLKPDVNLPGGHVSGDFGKDRLYLSMFKNIPQAEVDMLLPGSNIRFSWLDRTKIFAPTLGGIGVAVIKVLRGAVVIAATGLAAVLGVVILIVGIVGYAVRSIFSYLHTKDKYLLHMARSLYFQKLGSNAGVIYRLLQEARQQELLEVITVYFILATTDESLTPRELGMRVESLLDELLAIEIRFDTHSAMARLRRLGIVIDGGSGTMSVLSPETSIRQLNHYWDNLITWDRATSTDAGN